MTRDDIITEARRWLGTRWRHQAAIRGVGCDCIGLIAGVALALGSADAAAFLDHPAYRNYGRQPDPRMLLSACAELLEPVDEAQRGDVLLLRFTGEPQHFAFRSDPGYMIHAYTVARRVVENRIDNMWGGRSVRAYSLRGVA